MHVKRIVTLALLAFVIVSLGALALRERGREAPDIEPAVKAKAVEGETAGSRVTAYYFHGNVRCTSCEQIEALSELAIRNTYADELASGRLAWQTVNVQTPGNEHFMKDYQLSFWSLVLVETRDGQQTRWKNCDKAWDLLGDPDAFTGYVREEVSTFLKEG